MSTIYVRPGYASPTTIILRSVAVAVALASTTIYLEPVNTPATTIILRDPAAAPAGDSGITGTLAKTLGPLVVTAFGTVDVRGSASILLGQLAMSASGTVDIRGSANILLGALTMTGAGEIGTATVVEGAWIIRARRRGRR